MVSAPRRPLVAALVAATCLMAACSGGSTPQPQQEASKPASAPIDPATVATVTGHITLQGTAPANTPIKTKTDPNCAVPISTQSYVVGKDGSLANVFVYVKDGLGNRVFAAPTESVVLGQKNCQYEPHVLGIQVGQTLDIISSDPTLHNVHGGTRNTNNQEFNYGQPSPGVKNQHTFSTKEVLYPFSCDVHKWMGAFVGIVDNPFYAVTTPDGTFSLTGLPPGTYTVEAVHEKLGRQTQSVTVGEKETKDVAFTFKI
jgi:plastocyanin